MAREDRIDSLNQEVGELYAQGRYREALEPAREAVDLARERHGSRHADVAAPLNNLAELYRATGSYSAAEPLFREALAITRESRGARHPDVASVLNNLAGLHNEVGDYSVAKPLHQEALSIRREALGDHAVEVGYSLNNLAEVHRHQGEYAAAEPLYREALDTHRKVQGELHPDLVAPLGNLATLHRDLGDYAAAEILYRKALEVGRESFGDRSPLVARTLNNLGAVHHDMGDYGRAARLYREALAIRRESLGERHPDVAQTLGNLAGLHRDMGDGATGEPLYREALAIDREALGAQHPKVATDLGNLAGVHRDRGDHATAASFFEEAIALYREVLGPAHPNVAIGLANMAGIKLDTRDYPAAVSLYREALSIHREALGERHPFVAQDLNNLATTYQVMGDRAAAEPLCEKALHVRRQALGDEHPSVAWSLTNLAVLRAATDREEGALDALREAAGIDDGILAQVLTIGSEHQRLLFLDRIRDVSEFLLTLVLRRFPREPTVVGDAFDLVLRRKGVAAEALAAQRNAILAGRTPALAGRLQELTKLRMRIVSKTLAGPGSEGLDEHRRVLNAWDREKESIEAELAQAIPEVELQAQLREIDRAAAEAALPAGTVLVEFVRFDEFDFRAVPARDEPQWKPARYLAFLLRAGDPDGVRMVDLGEAGPIDEMIAAYRGAVTGEGGSRGTRGTGRAPTTSAEQRSGAALRRAVFDPLVPHLGDRTRLFLAPDGDLTRLPFEVLPTDDGRRLIEDYVFSYLSTGRDVIRFKVPPEAAGPPLVAAAPDFDLGGVSSQEGPPPGRRSRDLDPTGIRFGPLAGTQQEGEVIGKLLGVPPRLGDAVLEAPLKASRSPWILHLATHGFFLPNERRVAQQETPGLIETPAEPGPLRGPGMENPLLRSGLALAGANTFLDGGVPPPEAEDGLLTAEDVSGLDLLGTELVVLSACETGLGEVRIGEGVFGLRRSFVLAGARTLVMSLWKVPDKPSADLMKTFYANLETGMPRAEALREAQLKMAGIYPSPWYWGAFICQGDPGPLRGPLPAVEVG